MSRRELTSRQLEELTDKITNTHEDAEIGIALILLMDEVESVALSVPLDIENITVPAKDRAFYRTFSSRRHSYTNVEDLIKELWSKRGLADILGIEK